MSDAPLKPCPFCGAEAQMLGGPMAQDRYEVWCKSQGKRHHINGTMDADQTAAIWNTRADAAKIAKLQARAEAAEAALVRAYMAGRDDAATACDWGDIYGDNAVRSILALPVPADLAKRLGVSHE